MPCGAAPGDDRYSTRWAKLKEHFTREFLANGGVKPHVGISARLAANGDYGMPVLGTSLLQ